MSIVLLLLDWRKGRIVILSRDISYSLTNHVAYRYYVLKSYPHYCFFAEILNSRKTVDVLAFFVFYAFKSWKRLFLAEFPRVYISTLNMYDVLTSYIPKNLQYSNPILQYSTALARLYEKKGSDITALTTIVLATFTITMWFISFVVIVVAFFMYFPLLYIIRGNLKEYVCHKIDKRISEILRKKSKKRTEEARKAELAEIERNGEIEDDQVSYKPAPPLGLTQRPTLPEIDVDIDGPHNTSYGSGYGGSEYSGKLNGYAGMIPPPQGSYGVPPPPQFGGQILPPPVPPTMIGPGMYGPGPMLPPNSFRSSSQSTASFNMPPPGPYSGIPSNSTSSNNSELSSLNSDSSSYGKSGNSSQNPLLYQDPRYDSRESGRGDSIPMRPIGSSPGPQYHGYNQIQRNGPVSEGGNGWNRPPPQYASQPPSIMQPPSRGVRDTDSITSNGSQNYRPLPPNGPPPQFQQQPFMQATTSGSQNSHWARAGQGQGSQQQNQQRRQGQQ
ncbi:hypothetical protein BCR33DRAFT_716454 [Rhizoclosmatium globosum]|uniref:Uncharacterized protein n=1 Tax=Rhizoclosmatium globosum TaxID=329046 RepID=A0A1Y2CFP0_9FUNG|nr:hypothetical protein BCR33DRAFT_716454 [Rhizoclosmatium globosum]|eukprot:ORY45115.1 hypothetical protein BCR33DRAFT_716454 [Rhizoclosmatium globosum]